MSTMQAGSPIPNKHKLHKLPETPPKTPPVSPAPPDEQLKYMMMRCEQKAQEYGAFSLPDTNSFIPLNEELDDILDADPAAKRSHQEDLRPNMGEDGDFS